MKVAIKVAIKFAIKVVIVVEKFGEKKVFKMSTFSQSGAFKSKYWIFSPRISPLNPPESQAPKRRIDVTSLAACFALFNNNSPPPPFENPGYAPDADVTCASVNMQQPKCQPITASLSDKVFFYNLQQIFRNK